MRLLLLLLHAANASLFQYFRRHKVKDAIPAAIASTIVRANASGHFPFDWNRLTLCEVLRKRGKAAKGAGRPRAARLRDRPKVPGRRADEGAPCS